jgi:protein-export membrane protein SecD
VDVDGVIREYLEAAKDSARDELRAAKILYKGLGVQDNAVVLQLVDPDAREQAREVLGEIAADLILDIDSSGAVRFEFPDEVLVNRKLRAVDQSIEIVRRRIDETGVVEPTIQRQGSDRILIQMPGVDDPERIKEILRTTAKMTFRFVDLSVQCDGVTANVPADVDCLPTDDAERTGGPRNYAVKKRVMVSGENLTDAQATRNDTGPIVSFSFDSTGGKKFCAATRDNVGELFAIVLDGKVISAPRIKDAICGGSGIIEGNFTAESAQDLALLLRAGALPATLRVEEERTVGAELGKDSIDAGKMASLMGLALICGALIVMYGLFGLFANIALVFNFVLLIAAMSLLQATLTLPGIAGMVLTLGMAVDANVLIHERIREEIRAGRGPVTAIDAGYKSAAGTITDSNLTVIISSFFLLILGSGTVKGFAVTLIIGTIISMFTAVVVARLCTVVWLRRARPELLPI